MSPVRMGGVKPPLHHFPASLASSSRRFTDAPNLQGYHSRMTRVRRMRQRQIISTIQTGPWHNQIITRRPRHLRLGRDRHRRGPARGGPRFDGSRRARRARGRRRSRLPARSPWFWRLGALGLGFWRFAPATRFRWGENGAHVWTLLLGPRLDLGGFAQLLDQPLHHLPP